MAHSGIAGELRGHSQGYQNGLRIAPEHINDYGIQVTLLEALQPDRYDAMMVLNRYQDDEVCPSLSENKNKELHEYLKEYALNSHLACFISTDAS